MRRLVPVVLVLVMLFACLGINAMDTEKVVGEVLYHQNFSTVTDIMNSGIRIGTASSGNSLITCPNEALEIETYDSGRVYVLFPDAEKGGEGSYTIEFTFKFTDIHSDNGFIAPILTCRGNEPSNITSAVIRADGTIDNFDEPAPELKEAIASGETVRVKIPVQSWVMHEMILTYGDTEYILERENVLVVNEGSMGFVVRNADVAVDEVYIVYGVDYDEKQGYYADNSYAADESQIVVPGGANESEEHSPATDDGMITAAVFGVFGIVGTLCSVRVKKKRL